MQSYSVMCRAVPGCTLNGMRRIKSVFVCHCYDYCFFFQALRLFFVFSLRSFHAVLSWCMRTLLWTIYTCMWTINFMYLKYSFSHTSEWSKKKKQLLSVRCTVQRKHVQLTFLLTPFHYVPHKLSSNLHT